MVVRACKARGSTSSTSTATVPVSAPACAACFAVSSERMSTMSTPKPRSEAYAVMRDKVGAYFLESGHSGSLRAIKSPFSPMRSARVPAWPSGVR